MYDIKKTQDELLLMLSMFHNYCEKNNLSYFMIGGTLLGAIRHHGFIPWDDDIDVAMPREEYDRFIEIAQNQISDTIEIRHFKNTKNSPIHYVKLINKNTTLIEDRYKTYVEGLYIDVFPIDYVTELSKQELQRCKVIWFTHMLIMNNVTTYKEKAIYKRVFQLWAKCRNLDKLHRRIEILMREKNKQESKYAINFLGAYKKKEIVPKEIFEHRKLYSFEGYMFYGPESGKEYLKHIYGDFMILPPVEEQVCKHNYYVLDFNKPYSQYEVK